MRIADTNLKAAFEALPPWEQSAVTELVASARWAESEAVRRLQSAAIRKIKFRLKRKVRGRRK